MSYKNVVMPAHSMFLYDTKGNHRQTKQLSRCTKGVSDQLKPVSDRTKGSRRQFKGLTRYNKELRSHRKGVTWVCKGVTRQTNGITVISKHCRSKLKDGEFASSC
jgi:hypothetical protein